MLLLLLRLLLHVASCRACVLDALARPTVAHGQVGGP